MPTVGKLNVVLTAGAGPFASAMFAAQNSVKTFGSVVSGIGGAVRSAMGSVVGQLGAAAGGISAMAGIGFGVKLAAEAETAQIAFKTMLGSGEAATKMISELETMAAKTPFQFPELRESAQRLLAMGFAAEKIPSTLLAVGDATAAMGGGGEMLGRITTALGQMLAKGKATGEEMKQLAETGLPVWDILAKAIGTTIPKAMKMAEQGAIPAGAAIEALLAGLQQRTGGAMAAMSSTTAGLWSSMKDSIGFVLRDIGAAIISTFDLKGKMGGTIEFFDSLRSTIGGSVAGAFGMAMTAAQGFGATVMAVWSPLIATVETMVGWVGRFVGAVFGAIGGMGGFAEGLGMWADLMQTVSLGVQAFFALFTAGIAGLLRGVAAILSGIEFMNASFVKGVAALIDGFSWLFTKLDELIEYLSGASLGLGEGLARVGQELNGMADRMRTQNPASAFVGGMADTVMAGAQELRESFWKEWQKPPASAAIKSTFAKIAADATKGQAGAAAKAQAAVETAKQTETKKIKLGATQQEKDEGKKLVEDMMLPLEEFEARTAKIKLMYQKGVIDRTTMERSMFKAGKEFAEAGGGMSLPSAMERGSKAALEFEAKTKSQGATIQDRQLKVQEKIKEAVEKSARRDPVKINLISL